MSRTCEFPNYVKTLNLLPYLYPKYKSFLSTDKCFRDIVENNELINCKAFKFLPEALKYFVQDEYIL